MSRVIFADTPAFVLKTALALRCLQRKCRSADLLVVLGVEARKMAADYFLLGVALEPLCSWVPGCDHPVGVEHVDGVIAYTLNKHTKAMLVAGEDSGMHSYIPLGGARGGASGRVRKPVRSRLVPLRLLLPSDRHVQVGRR